jgi:hypothetical protein
LYAASVPSVVLGQWSNWLYYTQGAAAATRWSATHATLITILQQTLGQVVGTLAAFGMVAAIGRNYRLVADPDQRRRIRWVACSSVVGLLPQIWWALVTDYNLAAGPSRLPLYSLFVNAMTLAVPLSVAYAVVRHRVLDITVVLRRTAQYLLARRGLEGLMAVPVAALVIAVVRNRHQTIAQVFAHNPVTIFWTAAVGVSIRFKAPLRAWLDRRFFREAYDRDALLLGLVDDLSRVDSLSDLGQLAGAQLEYALHPKALYIWYVDGSAFSLGYSSAPDPVPPSPAAEGIHLTIPIPDRDGRLVGLLMFGEKNSEEPYTLRDRRLLEAIARQVGVVRDNLRLSALVHEERRIRHEVLARLDGQVNVLRECPACGSCFDGTSDRCDSDGAELTLSLPVERTLDRRYRLDRLIGRGGMGAVYEAMDLQLARPVAVKVIAGPEVSRPETLRRFQHEARAAARLRHPNIVDVHDCGMAAQAAFLVMERVHGRTMRAELQASALSGIDAAEWFDQILDGLGAAHAQGVVHRDLKPENIVGERSSSGVLRVKILDFGLAKLRPIELSASNRLTASGVVIGTFGYMSPEQLLGRDVDERTDIFALGVMVVEALTGRKPFNGDTYAHLLRSTLQDEYRLPGFSPAARALDGIVQRCLAKSVDGRFPSVAMLQCALVPALRAYSVDEAPGSLA